MEQNRARWAKPLWNLAMVMLTLGAALMLFVSDTWFGMDTEVIGRTLMPVSVVAGVIALTAMPAGDSRMGVAEKISMLSLIVTLVVGGYLFAKFRELGWNEPPGREASKVITLALVLVLLGICVVHAARLAEDHDEEDEHDREIQGRAASRAYAVLFAMLLMFASAVSLSTPLACLTSPTGIFHALVFVILLSELVRFAWEVWLYREGRLQSDPAHAGSARARTMPDDCTG